MKTVSKFNFNFMDLWIGGSGGVAILQTEYAVIEGGYYYGCSEIHSRGLWMAKSSALYTELVSYSLQVRW